MIAGNFTYNHYRVYNLIFKRFIASQMRPFKYQESEVNLNFPNINYEKKINLPIQVIEN
jgi:reverse gyrase